MFDRAFAQVLDEALARTPETPPGPQGASERIMTPPLWDLPRGAASRARAMRTPWVPHARPPGGDERRVGAARIDRSGRREAHGAEAAGAAGRPRALTARQRLALSMLRRLGATELTPSFSARQLRAAFRALAKRFHPDRHPASGAAEKARLASTFARICDAYHELAGADPAAGSAT